jgi:putative DNA methylase
MRRNEKLLEGIFAECRRAMKPSSHLIFSYANRNPEAWTAVFKALDRAGFRAVGYQLLHSENETDYAKRDVRACTLDLLMDLTPDNEEIEIERWKPPQLPKTDEAAFLGIVAETFLCIGELGDDWEEALEHRLRASAFLSSE